MRRVGAHRPSVVNLLPLYFAGEGQVNAQVPFDLAEGTETQLVVRAGDAFTVPEAVSLAAAQPGIFTVNSSGSGPGAVLDAAFQLVTSGNPARPGAIIQVFVASLGATTPAVRTGEVSPASPPATVTRAVTATIGGMVSTPQFTSPAWLPAFVGLYQVNVQVPDGVASGEVSLVIRQDDVESNTVTIFVQR